MNLLDDERQLAASSNSPTDTVFTSNYAGPVTVRVARTGGSAGVTSVDYSTQPLNATPGVDYTPVTGTLTWAGGDSTDKTFSVPIIDDLIPEAADNFHVLLSTAVGLHRDPFPGPGADRRLL